MKTTTKHGERIGSNRSQKTAQRVRSGPLGQVLPPLIGIFACFLFPTIASASVQITEIMYDTPGSDAGHEWIEITNTGSQTVDVGKYKLLESGTNHGLTLVAGNTMLAAGSSAIIASDAKKFAGDYPSFSGNLFDSTFALSNTGELLVIKDASSSVQDTVAYNSSLGAVGDGGSLHRQADTFIVALPTPGIFPGVLQNVPKALVPVATAPVKKTPTTSSKKSLSTYQKNTSAGNSVKKSYTAHAASAYISPTRQMAAPESAPAIPQLFLWIIGCAAIVLLGIAGVIFTLFTKKETNLSSQEFKIE